jgi:hypothetical protein
MSLDIYITEPEITTEICQCPKCDNEHEHSYYKEIVNLNCTHNLGKMAVECGIYDYMWRPDENGVDTCIQMIAPLTEAIRILERDPKHFESFNPKNGWGSYEGLLKFLRGYLQVCIDSPNAKIRVWR